MPWLDRVTQLQLMQTEYVQVVEENLIFNERDEEGNQIPPSELPPPEEPPPEELPPEETPA